MGLSRYYRNLCSFEGDVHNVSKILGFRLELEGFKVGGSACIVFNPPLTNVHLTVLRLCRVRTSVLGNGAEISSL